MRENTKTLIDYEKNLTGNHKYNTSEIWKSFTYK